MKQAPQSPPRLVADPELSEAIRWTQEDNLSSERLTKGEDALIARLKTPSPPPNSPAATGTTTAAAKLMLPLLAVTGVALYFGMRDETPLRSEPAVPAREQPEPAEHDISEARGHGPEAEQRTELVVEPTPPQKRRDAGHTKPVDGVLDEQLAIFQRAKAVADRGAADEALRLLDELEARYPETPLREEIAVSRAHYFVTAERLNEARKQIQLLLTDPAHEGRTGELLRLLGDVWIKGGNCTRAVETYRRAQSHRLSDSERQAVARGIEKCKP